jgi:hypothetical protein
VTGIPKPGRQLVLESESGMIGGEGNVHGG